MQSSLAACHCCGLVQAVPPVPPGSIARCPRCGTRVRGRRRGGAGNAWSGAAALAALVLYPLAVSQPIMLLERFGHRTAASVWTGSVGLLEKGEWFVGGVVLLCSLVLPLLKLAGLIGITYGRHRLARRHRAFAYRLIEWTGRWGMLDVLLISIVVAWVKIGDLVEVTAGPAAFAFAGMVILSLLAGAWFDPHAIWEEPARPRPRT